jgi:cytochrome c oxidase subunit 1
LGLAGIPRRYSDYPDFFIGWNVLARIGSIISIVSVILLIFILWERFASQRPCLFFINISSILELTHSFPPIVHSYLTTPVIFRV